MEARFSSMRNATMPGSSPKLIMSARESSSLPMSDVTCRIRAAAPSKKSNTALRSMNIKAKWYCELYAAITAIIPDSWLIRVMLFGICFFIVSIYRVSI